MFHNRARIPRLVTGSESLSQLSILDPGLQFLGMEGRLDGVPQI
jgi:hypothetical protein